MNKRAQPRLVVAAASSSAGKTTATCALLMALRQKGLRPAAFKCGPDYIDPMFHEQALGVPAYNYDPVLLGSKTAAGLFVKNAASADISVIEGVMGYYDGVGSTTKASTYEAAGLLRAPVVLVVSCKGAALSLAALIKGFLAFRADSRIAGVLLNRVSPALYPALKEAIERECGITVYGFLPENERCRLESRHLGLIPAQELKALPQKLSALAEDFLQTVDVAGLIALAHTAPPLTDAPYRPKIQAGELQKVKIALAKDNAFCFYYRDGLSLLEALGAELCYFSPLTDKRLPSGVQGMLLGGGYPEVFARQLSNNREMRQAIKNAVESGMPTVAECGGFLYLHQTIEDTGGDIYPQVGVIPAHAKREGLKQFGYTTLRADRDTPLLKKGERIPAHEFHYWQSSLQGGALTATKLSNGKQWSSGYITQSLFSGFSHIHPCACETGYARFLATCKAYEGGEKPI